MLLSARRQLLPFLAHSPSLPPRAPWGYVRRGQGGRRRPPPAPLAPTYNRPWLLSYDTCCFVLPRSCVSPAVFHRYADKHRPPPPSSVLPWRMVHHQHPPRPPRPSPLSVRPPHWDRLSRSDMQPDGTRSTTRSPRMQVITALRRTTADAGLAFRPDLQAVTGDPCRSHTCWETFPCLPFPENTGKSARMRGAWKFMEISTMWLEFPQL